MLRRKLVPPDGGWGWMIAAGVALNFFIIFPIAQTFGLLYKDIFNDLGFTGTQNTLILNTNLAVSNICGIVIGPLIKHYGYRAISFASGIFIVLGLIFTAHSTRFEHFMIAYGIITSLGYGMGLQGFSVALNSYFVKKRSKVNGYVSAIYGLGPILMPQLVSYMMTEFDVKSIMIILAAVAGHVLVAALLLQPVEWHMVPVKEDEINEEEDKFLDSNEYTRSRRPSVLLTDSNISLHAISRLSIDELTGSVCFEQNTGNNNEKYKMLSEKASFWERFIDFMNRTFNFEMLKDPTFVSIVLGLSLDFLSEINCLILIPFIMADFNLTTEQIAIFMSTFAIADIILRFLAPYIAEILNRPERQMLMITLLCLICARSSLLFVNGFVPLLFCAVAIGSCRGARLVYWSLVMPCHVPIEKLPAALGLQFTINGILIFMGGPLLGVIKDVTGTYVKCIYLINLITFMAVLIWSIEFIIKKYKSKKIDKKENCDI
ncbi:monocarboxylate transporter 7-like isoform X2 [Onthophagus taurus]|uniref:monocarboxylate transporter 7-like isoform X2 n=1 Tax=Onthophagus taurus TaxID=166361 RepID=UPI000C20A857|nr:monocarboxylate transporter 7-like isoform X2 [Onthophagus taurus]